MRKPLTRRVEFYSEGKKIVAETDLKTARAIDVYKIVYNKIQDFDIKTRTMDGTHDGFVRDAIYAQSRKLKVVCTKEYMPNVPEIVCAPQYTCGIANTRNNKFESVPAGVSILYYKLFSERIK